MGLRASGTQRVSFEELALPDEALLGDGGPDIYRECVQLGRLGWCALESKGRPSRHRHRAALRRARGGGRLRRGRAAREMGPRHQDPRHLRGHPADPAAHHRAVAARPQLDGAQVGRRDRDRCGVLSRTRASSRNRSATDRRRRPGTYLDPRSGRALSGSSRTSRRSHRSSGLHAIRRTGFAASPVIAR